MNRHFVLDNGSILVPGCRARSALYQIDAFDGHPLLLRKDRFDDAGLTFVVSGDDRDAVSLFDVYGQSLDRRSFRRFRHDARDLSTRRPDVK